MRVSESLRFVGSKSRRTRKIKKNSRFGKVGA